MYKQTPSAIVGGFESFITSRVFSDYSLSYTCIYYRLRSHRLDVITRKTLRRDTLRKDHKIIKTGSERGHDKDEYCSRALGLRVNFDCLLLLIRADNLYIYVRHPPTTMRQ